METWEKNLADTVENFQHFHESKEIHSFETVKAFFKNVFYEYINELDDCHAGLTEKSCDISFYIGGTSMTLIDQDDQISIWKTTPAGNKIIALIAFNKEYCFVKYVQPVNICYMCEDEIKKIFHKVFPQPVPQPTVVH